MNVVDVVLIAFILLPGLLGAWRGMLWPIAVTVGVAGGGVASLLFGPLAADLLPEAAWAPLAGAALVFVLVFTLVQALRWALRRLLEAVHLKWVDHLAGGLAAAAVGLVAGAWVVTAVTLVLPDRPRAYEESLLARHAEVVACRTGLPCELELEAGVLDQSDGAGLRGVLDALPLDLKQDDEQTKAQEPEPVE